MAGAAAAICGPGACYPFATLGPDTASAMMPGKPFDGDVIDLQRGNARLQDPLGKMPCLAQSPGIGRLAVADGFEPAGKRCQMLIQPFDPVRDSHDLRILQIAEKPADIGQVDRVAQLTGAIAPAATAVSREAINGSRIEILVCDLMGSCPLQKVPSSTKGASCEPWVVRQIASDEGMIIWNGAAMVAAAERVRGRVMRDVLLLLRAEAP